MSVKSINFQTNDFLVCILTSLVVYFLLSFYWKRRRLYYHASKIPGPLSFPIIGSIHLLLMYSPKEVYNVLINLSKQYLPIFKMWLGPDLYIITSRPKDFEKILPRNLEKGDFYNFGSEYFEKSLLTSPVSLWKEHRKIINKIFNTNILNTSVPVLHRHSTKLKASLKMKEPNDVFPIIWKATFESVCETFADVEVNRVMKKDEFLRDFLRYEEIISEHFCNILYHSDYFWKNSQLKKEALEISQNAKAFVEEIMKLRKTSPVSIGESLEDDTVINVSKTLFGLEDARKLSHEALLHETPPILIGGSETTAITISTVLLILGMYPDIQEKIYEELMETFGNENSEPTLNTINSLDYLERVIKETMRLSPAVPFYLRTLNEDVVTDDYVFPAGTRIVFDVPTLHKRKDLWVNPLKFNPDRFLPEENKMRNRFAYMPFSYGARNCIGHKYAMLAAKVILANILRSYKVTRSVDYHSLEEIDYVFLLVAKATKGYRVVLEERS